MSYVRTRDVRRAHVEEVLEGSHRGCPQSEHLGDSARPCAEVAIVSEVLSGKRLLLDGIRLRDL